MKNIISILTIFIIGALSVSAMAQEADDRKVYVITDIMVQDREAYAQYQDKVAPIIKKYGGRYLIRSGAADLNTSSENNILFSGGGWNPDRIVILEFPSQMQLRTFFESDEYIAIAPIREGSSTTKSIMVKEYTDGH